MTTKRYCVFMIPAAHRPAANLVMALVNGDNPALSVPFRVEANPTSNHLDPVTHFYGGMSVDEDWLALVSNLGTDMIAPPEDTAWTDFGFTEVDVIAAAEAMHLQVTITQDGAEPSPQMTLANALGAFGVKSLVYPD